MAALKEVVMTHNGAILKMYCIFDLQMICRGELIAQIKVNDNIGTSDRKQKHWRKTNNLY